MEMAQRYIRLVTFGDSLILYSTPPVGVHLENPSPRCNQGSVQGIEFAPGYLCYGSLRASLLS